MSVQAATKMQLLVHNIMRNNLQYVRSMFQCSLESESPGMEQKPVKLLQNVYILPSIG